MNRRFLILAGITGATAVAAGAFGAHLLKDRLSPESLAIFETGARYHLVHALAIGLVAVLVEWRPARLLSFAGFLFAGGILLFSGSLYGLALGGPKWLGPVTPAGGTALILGWISLGLAGLRRPRD